MIKYRVTSGKCVFVLFSFFYFIFEWFICLAPVFSCCDFKSYLHFESDLQRLRGGEQKWPNDKKNIRFFFSSFVPLFCWCFFIRFHRFYYSKDNICTSRLKLLRAQMKKIQVVANNPNVYTVYFKYRLRVFFFHVYLLPWNIIFMVVVCIICTAFWMIHMHTYIIESGYKYTQSEKK